MPSTGFNYRADQLEGEGLLDNPTLSWGLPGGVSLAWHTPDGGYCGCGRPGGGVGTCNDIFTANAANNKILYVGGNSSNHNYEAVYGPPGPKNTCSLNNEIVRLRIGIYAKTKQFDITPPVVTVPPNIVAEATGPSGAVVTYAATAVDDVDGPLTPTCTPPSGSTFRLGVTTVTCSATDAAGNTGSASFTVAIRDTTPPNIMVTLKPELLWPPSHKMVEIATTVIASDIVDTSVSLILSSVTSNEADDEEGEGDGNTTNDIQGADTGTADFSFLLRAERGGNATGRVYTATYTATDDSGNSASASAIVIVPHDRGN